MEAVLEEAEHLTADLGRIAEEGVLQSGRSVPSVSAVCRGCCFRNAFSSATPCAPILRCTNSATRILVTMARRA